jgi:RNA polymerase sigma-70 factor, ECF subfamily
MTLPPQTQANPASPGSPEIDPEEARLVREAVDGNARSFEGLIRLHSRRVFNFLHQMTRHRQDAEDLTQQTFIKAFRNIQTFQVDRPLINWLLTIARRTALNHFRSARRWEEMPADSACSAPSPARAAEVHDRTSNLWARARRVLSQKEFEVLWLRFAEELSIEETARVTGLTETNIKILVFRGRRQLLKGENQL